MRQPWPLVGRTHEMSVLLAHLTAGPCSAVVIAGPAGVGKSWLASACVADAEAKGMVAARVKGAQSARHLPFGALAPLLPGTTGPSVEPADMLRRSTAAIVALGQGRPLVVLVDDAHLLDGASATVIHQLASTRAAFVLATVRTGEAAPDPVVALWKDELAQRLDLSPLGRGDIEEILTTVLGGRVSPATVHQLAERSAGNALYLRELVLAGEESGQLAHDGGTWRLDGAPGVSSRLVELIEDRLRGVRDPDRKVLDALAFGEPLGVQCLLRLTTAHRLEALEARGLIVTSSSGRRLEATLAHPLYGEVIRARIPALRSQAVLQNLANRLQAAGARRREDALRFAAWRLDAGGDMAPDLMVAAAATARNRWDLDLARRLAEAAVQAGAGIEAALLQAEISVLLCRPEDAEEQLAALLRVATTDDQRARAVAARVEYLVSRLGRIDEAVHVAAEGAAMLTDPDALDLVLSKQAFALDMGGRLHEALAVLEPVLARSEGAPSAFAWYTAGACLVRTGRFTEALAYNEKGEQIDSDCTGTPPLNPFRRMTVLCSAHLWSGQLRDAYEIATSAYTEGVATGSITVQALFGLYRARIELMMGRVTDAKDHALEARHLFGDRHWRNLSRTALGLLAMANALGGSPEQAWAALAELDALGLPAEYLNEVEMGRAKGWAAAAGGDVSAAGDHLRAAAATSQRRGALVWEAEALHDLARLGWAAEVAPRLATLADIVEGNLATVWAEHAAALVAGDAARLSRVSATFEAMGAMLVAAEASAAAAVQLRRAGQGRQAAGAELRAADLARRCQGAVTPRLRAIQTQAVLSSREIEVAALAAAGLANKEIATRLSVSVRTVENHLQRVYEKLGVARRANLAQVLTSL